MEEDARESLDAILALDVNYKQAPVMSVEIDGKIVDHWTGYRPDKIDEYALATAA